MCVYFSFPTRRSSDLSMDEAVDQILSGLIVVFIDGHDDAFVVDLRSYPGRQPEEPDTERVIRGAREDRKSTRLNSSHVANSYAVFCLKKNTLNLHFTY